MVESTVGLGVHNSFQDEYGERKFVRTPLEKAGVNIGEFCGVSCSEGCVGPDFWQLQYVNVPYLTNKTR